MNTKPLEKFAQAARRQLHEQVRARLEQVMSTDSPELRAKASVVAELNKQIAHSSRQAVVEQVAYTWFNRFCALRYMDANRYTRLGIVSPATSPTGETFTQPEILQEAKAGHIDDDLAPFVDSQRIFDLLTGRTPSANPQQEAYRLLLVGSCNQYHAAMPFLFEKIDHYSELLMPTDLLSASSILQQMREALTDDACQDVEVIGWLYQFYISEKKDEVIGAKKAINPADIPAATQLFTPHWIVRYLVENSLGRLWLQSHPQSRIVDSCQFLVVSEENALPSPFVIPRSAEESAFSASTQDSSSKTPRNDMTNNQQPTTPAGLRICDPAVGSGHMLTYAFDLLYAIYEEQGYNPTDIPRLILQHNLTGLEIDERAADLAAFALTMKARAKDRRFFRRGVAPHIVTLHPIAFTDAELDAEVAALTPLLTGSWQETPRQMSLLAEGQKQLSLSDAGGLQELRQDLRHDLALFREADNLGSLLRPRLSAAQLTRLHDHLCAPADTGQLNLFHEERRKKARQAIAQAIPLAQLYDVVIANPPYMGSKNQNDKLKKFLNDNYADVKADLFSAFTARILEMTHKGGFIGMMTPFNWMFLSSFEKMRQLILDNYTLTNLVRPEFHAFFDSAFVTICAFTLYTKPLPEYKGAFIDLQKFYGADVQPVKALEAIQNPDCGYFYRAAATDFQKIPGSPIAYWLKGVALFSESRIGDYFISGGRNKTHNNERYLRFFWEVSKLQANWKAYANGGEFRKYYGNEVDVVNWSIEARDFYASQGGLANERFWGKEGITWNLITSSTTGFRIKPADSQYSSGAPTIFDHSFTCDDDTLAFLNSPIAHYFLKALNPTLNTTVNVVLSLPLLKSKINSQIAPNTQRCRVLAKADWDSYETSWDFTTLPLLQSRQPGASLAAAYATLRQGWQAATLEMQRLEEENNRLFIAAYGLQDELTPEVPLSEITLTCNPHYRYGNQSSVNGDQLKALTDNWSPITDNWLPGDEGHEIRLLADTMREFISYAVGCMYGRYSLDAPGLILANQGETVAEYEEKVIGNQVSVIGEPSTDNRSPITDHRPPITFPPDRDNAIPMLDGDWFSDDVTERFKKFLRVTFGEAHYAENLAFIEAALGRDIRSYFLREFYNDHVKMYKKRPIYWLFSSAKGSFNVLIYMHRYRPDTVSIVLNDYLREFRAKLTARKSHLEGVSVSASATPRDKTQALKEVAAIQKTLQELRDYEDDILYPMATQQLQIDLDDGVLVNYNKFGKALKKITGLSDA